MQPSNHWLIIAGLSVCWLAGSARAGDPKAEPDKRPRLVAQLGHPPGIRSVAFSPDGKQVLTGGEEWTARLWDAQSGMELRAFTGHGNEVWSVAFSPDGKQVLTGSEDRTARLWDVLSGKELRVFTGHADIVSTVAFSSDGEQVLTGSWDKTARLWNARSGNLICVFAGHAGKIFSVAIAPDGKQILTGSSDKTARLWDVESGKELRAFTGHANSVNSVAFAPDGKQVLTGSFDKTARLWHVETGKELRAFSGHTGNIMAVAFAPDGKQVLTGSMDKTARLWDAGSGAEIHRFEGHLAGLRSVKFAPDDKQVLTGSGDGTARLWDAATGKAIRTLQGRAERIISVAFAPDGSQLLTGSSDTTARFWDGSSGKEVRALRGHSNTVYSVAFAPDGKQMMTGSGDGTARLWDTRSGKNLRTLSVGAEGGNVSVAFSPDGKQVLTGSWDKPAQLWDAQTGELLRAFTGYSNTHDSVAFSPDGKQVLAGSHDYSSQLWDVQSGQFLRAFTGHSGAILSVAFSPDGKYVLTGSDDRTARLWDVQSGKELRAFKGHSLYVYSVAFSPDGKRVLTGSADMTARLWDAQSGEELRVFTGHANRVYSVAFAPDGKHVLTGSLDSTTRIWDAQTGQELCKLISFADGTWAVVDSEGRFDAPNGGDVEGLHWVVENEPIALSQLKQRYYDPGLLAKHMGFNKQPLRPVADFNESGVKLYPEVAVDLPADGKKSATITLTNRGGGIGKVVVLVNGQELLGDARGPKANPDIQESTLSVDLSAAVNLVKGKPNIVEVIAYDAEGFLASRRLTKIITPDGDPDERPPELYAIVCGVSHYADPKLNLQFADKDAEDFASALELGGKRLFGADRVHLTLLDTTDASGATAPTKENIRKAFAAAEKAKPGDVLVVYLAGHGTTLGRGSDLYLYPTQDATSLDGAAFADKKLLESTAISSAELTQWLLRIAVNKRVMVLDTCAAGAAAAKLTEKRDIDGDQVRALDQLKDRTGYHVLMGCAADRVSYESTQFAQGLLTYSLLEGMKGAALQPGGVVDVRKLFERAVDRVPQLAGGRLGGMQRPEIIEPKAGQSFAIGRMTDEDLPKVRLAVARPVVLRSSFQEEVKPRDSLGLSKKVDQRLRGLSSRGRDAELVFFDADEFPDAYELGGRYELDGETATVNTYLFRGKETIKLPKETGTKDKLDELADRISRDVEKVLSGKK